MVQQHTSNTRRFFVTGTTMIETTLHIEKMDCPTEEQLIRSRLQGFDGIDELSFDLLQRNLTIKHQRADLAPVLNALEGIGMTTVLPGRSDDARKKAWERPPVASRAERIQLILGGLFALAAEIIALVSGSEDSLLVVGLAVLAILLGGRKMLLKGWQAVRAFSLGINFLMTLAVVGAVIIGEWPEAAMVTVLFALAEMIEAYALDRSRGAIRSLMKLSPDTALVHTEEGEWVEMASASVHTGQRIRIRPGERIPLDGQVRSGTSTVNQAPITGESMPVEKTTGDDVFAGTVNERGSLEVEVTHQKRDTTLARIIRAVQQAQSERGATQRFVDTFARYYTPTVVVCWPEGSL